MPTDPSSDLAGAEAGLTDPDVKAIKDAILVAFPEKPELYGLLLDKWGVRAGDVVFVEQAGALAIAALVDWAKGQGRALEMLSLAWTEKHRQHRPLQDLAERFFPAPETEIRKYAPDASPAMSAMASAPSFAAPAAILKSVRVEAEPPMLDARLIARLAGATGLVAVGAKRSTGFLIGRRTLLTVHHVATDALAEDWSGEAITFRPDGGDATEVLAAAPGLAWRGPFSRASQADIDGTGEPSPDELDFIVIRLAHPVGPDRAVLALPETVPIVAPGDPMVIAQHPEGGPLQFATGKLLGYSAAGARLHYDVPTRPGSAGSPVVTPGGQLIAIHHARRVVDGPRVAQGVPIWPIRQAIVAAGYRLDDL